MQGVDTNRGLLLGLYALTLALPGYIFFDSRGGFVLPASFTALMDTLFPLFGLYAFIFLANQAIIGANADRLGRYFVNITHYHRRLGAFAFLFALLHPLAILMGYGIAGYIGYDFVSSRLAWWTLPGYLALVLLLLTAGTAIINWKIKRISWWRSLHRLNYLVFALAWVHSWFIGTHVQTTPLRWLWTFYLLVITLGFTNKYLPKIAELRSHE